MKVYVVFNEWGEYEDRGWEIVCVCKTLEKAQKICEDRKVEIVRKDIQKKKCSNCKFNIILKQELDKCGDNMPKCFDGYDSGIGRVGCKNRTYNWDWEISEYKIEEFELEG